MQGHIDPKTPVVQITVGFWLPTAPNNLRFCSHLGATRQHPEIGMAHTVKFQYRKLQLLVMFDPHSPLLGIPSGKLT